MNYITLKDMVGELAKISQAANDLTVKGKDNATIIVYITRRCEELTQAITAALEAEETETTEG